MRLTETKLKGCFIIEAERFEDDRGFLAQAWSLQELGDHGIDVRFVESNFAFNFKKGTLRGLHFQASPHEQAKLIRCTRGSVFDVAVDLRPDSPTFKQWVSMELSADNLRMFFIPRGFAHGYQTLQDNSEVCYEISSPYAPASCRGVRWNDPAFGIEWPEVERRIMVARDREYPDFEG
jgi:dTDP-4-dehydrorhamnose 3,5-epimerase